MDVELTATEKMFNKIVASNVVLIQTETYTLDFLSYDLDLIMSLN